LLIEGVRELLLDVLNQPKSSRFVIIEDVNPDNRDRWHSGKVSRCPLEAECLPELRRAIKARGLRLADHVPDSWIHDELAEACSVYW
jgi:phenylpyruvate tautomerase PptA (4-oxalocrotonate tautomerase family)